MGQAEERGLEREKERSKEMKMGRWRVSELLKKGKLEGILLLSL